MAQPEEGHKLFIGDLPQDITQEELQTVFGTYGQVTNIHLLAPNPNARNRCALLWYSQKQSADDAISVLNGIYKIREGAEFPIKVAFAKEKNQVENVTPHQDPEGFKLFVGGLPVDCTQEELNTVFGTYGQVAKVHIMPPHAQTGRVAAFVYYTTAQAAEDAMSVLHEKYKIRADAELPILVKWAQNKDAKGAAKGGAWNGGWNGGNDWGSAGGKGWGAPAQKVQCADGWKIFVGGLPGDITESELSSVFQTYGEVTKVHTMPPNAQGAVAAFVFYKNEQSGEDAIKVLNKIYKIREDAPEPIQVRWASDKSAKGGDAGKGWGGCSSWDGGKGKGSWDGGKGAWGGGYQQQGWSAGGQQSLGYGGGWGGAAAGYGGGYGGGWGGKDAGKGGKDGGKGEQSDTKLFVGNLPSDTTDEALKYVFGTYGTVQHVHVMTGKSKSGSSCAFVEFTNASEADTAILTLNDKYEIKPGCGTIMVKKANAGRPKPY